MTKRTSLPDQTLVERVLSGDVEYYAVLVERYRTQLARYAVSLCGDSDVAADAMQESFVRAFNSLASCRDPAKFRSWFTRILTNQCHNMRTRTRTHVALDDVEAAAHEEADTHLTSSEIGQAIERALDALTPEQREAFVLKHIEGYSYAEMAELLDAAVDALKMRVYRAREIVKEQLQDFV
jgi:RNA polymerase sigma-70 factor (ECF subfamily)